MKQLARPFAVLSALALLFIPLALAGAQGEDALAGSQWGLVSLDAETPAIPGSGVTLEFGDDGRVSGSAGCNRFGGGYSIDGGAISFSQLFSTRMLCPQDEVMDQEITYLAALEAATGFAVEGNQLTITYGDDQQLIFTRFSPLTGTSWLLVSLDAETPAVEGSVVTLEFFEAGRVAGTAGCNRFGGSYEFDESAIRFSQLFSTMMLCVEDGIMEQEAAYLAALEAATSFAVEGNQLTITYGDDQQLVFIQQSPLTGTSWLLVSLDAETPAVEGSVVTLEFIEAGRVAGTAGCNRFGGGYEFDESAIRFSQLFSTMMLCVEDGIMEQEAAYLAALEAATGFAVEGNQLTITYGDGAELTFTRLSPLAGTAWELRSLDAETPVLPETTVTLQFGFDNRAFGSGGCNNFSGGYTTSEDSINFGMLISTLMACQDDVMAQEMAYFAALEAAASFFVADDQLFITYGDGQQLTFARAEPMN